MKLLKISLSNIHWGSYYDTKKGEIHSLLKKLTEKENNNEKSKGFIFDILTQINDLNLDKSSISEIKIKMSDQKDQENSQKIIIIPNFLLRNYKFVE